MTFKWKSVILLGTILITFLSIFILYQENQRLKEDLKYTMVNMKAYDMENSELKNQNITYQLTIDQLNYLNDSLLIKMNSVRKELHIKDKEIQRLEYLNSIISRTDTLYIRDTIFKEPNFKLDTLIGDNWYSLNLNMQYPNKVSTTPTFNSELYIITSLKKETIYPPKKCFIGRWFQRKHKVVEVKVVEKNPYINNKEQKFVEIIK